MHAGQACVVKEDNISERVYTIRESDTLVLQCLVTGHPRPQVSWALALLGSYPAHTLYGLGLEFKRKQEARSSYTPKGKQHDRTKKTGGKTCLEINSLGK